MTAFAALHGFMFAPVLLGNAVGASVLGWCFQLVHTYAWQLVQQLLGKCCRDGKQCTKR